MSANTIPKKSAKSAIKSRPNTAHNGKRPPIRIVSPFSTDSLQANTIVKKPKLSKKCEYD